MKSSEIIALVGQVATVDVSCGDVDCCTQVLHELSRVIAWAEARKVDVASRLAALAVESPEIFPEHVVATATRVSLGQATQPFKRAGAIESVPSFGVGTRGGCRVRWSCRCDRHRSRQARR